MSEGTAPGWVVDTSVLLDIFTAHPVFAQTSAECLSAYLSQGLVISPITYVELAPAFEGSRTLQDQFLAEIGISWPSAWTLADTEKAHALWKEHVARKRFGSAGKRAVADILIEAFAARFRGVITRNAKHFSTIPVVVPECPT